MEGLGLGLLEAQGRGLAVLAARTGGIPEAVDEGRTGMLFAAGDAEDLRARLRKLIADPGLRTRLGAAGPGWVRENFDWGKEPGAAGRAPEGSGGTESHLAKNLRSRGSRVLGVLLFAHLQVRVELHRACSSR